MGTRFVSADQGGGPSLFSDPHDAAKDWANKWHPIAMEDGAEYSSVMFWTKNKAGKTVYGVKNGIRFPKGYEGTYGNDYARLKSPGPYQLSNKDLPKEWTLYAYIHIHVVRKEFNENFSTDDYTLMDDYNVTHYYLVTPKGVVRYQPKSAQNSTIIGSVKL